MNGYFPSEYEEASDYEASDYEASDYEATDYAEARPRRPMRPPVRPSMARPTYRPPTPPGAEGRPVTQRQFKESLDNVAKQIGTNSKAIQMVDGRVRAVSAEQNRMGAALRKEIGERKKDSEGQRKALQSTKEAVIISQLLFPPGSSLSALGPLLLLGDGFGGATAGPGGGTDGGLLGGGYGLLLVALIASGGLGGTAMKKA